MQIGITGHRDFQNSNTIDSWITGIKGKYPQATIITGGAMGTDLIAARCAIENGLRSQVILPMPVDVFARGSHRTLLLGVLEVSEVVNLYPHAAKWETECLFERNQRIVDEADILIAFWDGREKGGTFSTVKTAIKKAESEPAFRIFNGMTRQEMIADAPLRDKFDVPEACIEGLQALQDRIGRYEYNFYNESADFECNESGETFERHELRDLDAEPETAVAARVSARLHIDGEEALKIASFILDFGIQYERYWCDRLKENYNDIFELISLSYEMHELDTPDTDAVNRFENTDDDTSLSSIYGWHRTGGRDWIENPFPTEQNPQYLSIVDKIEVAENLSSLKRLGKKLYDGQKEKSIQLKYVEWTSIWERYKKRKAAF